MQKVPQSSEVPGELPDPLKLVESLEGLGTDRKKYTYLRALFLEESDVDEYVQFLNTNGKIDLTEKQLTGLKGILEGYKVYLQGYLEQAGERIGRFDERLKQTAEVMANPNSTLEEAGKIAHTRNRVAQAIQIANMPRGVKGKSLREVTEKGSVSGTEIKKELSPEQQAELLKTVKARFEANMNRHHGLDWSKVQAKLEASPEKMWSLNEMERTGGEPDVVGFDNKTGEYIFFDCSAESPEGRRKICYDREAQELAKKQKTAPEGNAMDMAKTMGIEVLNEDEYRMLQKLGEFDEETSSWLKTPADIRKKIDALQGDRRYSTVRVRPQYAYFYTSIRAFRGSLRV